MPKNSKPKKVYYFTSESVSDGHPDKICDQVSDAILDAILAKDKNSKVACEVMVTATKQSKEKENNPKKIEPTIKMLIGGEINTKATNIDYETIARNVLKTIGHAKDVTNIDPDNFKIDVCISEQSQALNDTVNQKKAGDQGIMFGYATDEGKTDKADFMPIAIKMAHDLVQIASAFRKEGRFKNALPDMKSQVTIEFHTTHNWRIHNMLMSIQHKKGIDMEPFKHFVKKEIMDPVAKLYHANLDFEHYVNPAGEFTKGGPLADAGLTGRKIIVDTYGGAARHGGGCFSGKDGSKLDRTAAYMARYVAKNIVASGIAKRCELQLSYVIGQDHPVSFWINTHGTASIPEKSIIKIIKKVFDFSPAAMIKTLKMKNIKYLPLATFGHFGRTDLILPWEVTDKVKQLQAYVKDPALLEASITHQKEKKHFFEIIATSALDCKQLNEIPVDRIELATNLEVGGTTPSYETVVKALQATNIPIRVMVRTDTQSWVWTKREIAKLKKTIKSFNHLPIEGYVLGGLDEAEKIPQQALAELIQVAGNKNITFHKAFDHTLDQAEALKVLHQLGIDCILTNGGSQTAELNFEQLKQLQDQIKQIKDGNQQLEKTKKPFIKAPQLLIGGSINKDNFASCQSFQNFHLGRMVRVGNSYHQPINIKLLRKIINQYY